MRPDLPEHTSASQLATYARCPRQYRMKYVEHRVAERYSTNLALGQAVGSAIAWWFDVQRAGQTPDPDEGARILHADLHAALARDDVDWDDETPETLAAQGEKLLRLFLTQYGDLPVLRTEERVELPIIDPRTGEVMPRKLLGYLDLTLVDGSAIELKTAARAYGTDVERNLQFGAYKAITRARGAESMRLVAMIKTKTPRVQDLALQADEAGAQWFMAAAADLERAIAAGVFPPAPGTMSCSMCDFTGACAREGVVAVEAPSAQAA